MITAVYTIVQSSLACTTHVVALWMRADGGRKPRSAGGAQRQGRHFARPHEGPRPFLRRSRILPRAPVGFGHTVAASCGSTSADPCAVSFGSFRYCVPSVNVAPPEAPCDSAKATVEDPLRDLIPLYVEHAAILRRDNLAHHVLGNCIHIHRVPRRTALFGQPLPGGSHAGSDSNQAPYREEQAQASESHASLRFGEIKDDHPTRTDHSKKLPDVYQSKARVHVLEYSAAVDEVEFIVGKRSQICTIGQEDALMRIRITSASKCDHAWGNVDADASVKVSSKGECEAPRTASEVEDSTSIRRGDSEATQKQE